MVPPDFCTMGWTATSAEGQPWLVVLGLLLLLLLLLLGQPWLVVLGLLLLLLLLWLLRRRLATTCCPADTCMRRNTATMNAGYERRPGARRKRQKQNENLQNPKDPAPT